MTDDRTHPESALRRPRLSILDQSPVPEGSTGAQALQNTIDLARLVDALGYERYWVAEHHGAPMVAGPSPEVLIGPLAAATRRLRVGSAGVMLPHYSPLKVAESFSLLSGLFPGRIDMGIGRAAGTDPMTSQVLQRDRRHPPLDDFPQQLAELLGYFDDAFPPDHPLGRFAGSLPGRPEGPEPWLLGSSMQSGIWAAERGLRYAFADFINAGGAGVAELYRTRFEATDAQPVPHVAVGVAVIAADTDEEAERLASSSRMSFALARTGSRNELPSVEKALRFLAERGGPPGPAAPGGRAVVGAPETVRTGLESVAAEYGAQEVVAVTIVHDHQARRRSYEILADVFGLDAAATAYDEAA